MSDSKLSDLTAATSVAPADLAYVVQGGTSKKATREILQTYDAGTLTTDKKVLDLSATWNNAAVTFTGVKFNVTNTASAAASKVFDFQIGGTSAFMLDKSGNLGIGTNAPNRRLVAASDGSNWISGVFGGNGGTDVLVVGNIGAAATVGGHNSALSAWTTLKLQGSDLRFFTNSGTGDNERLRIDSSGNVGIGTTSANGKLSINDTELPYMTLKRADTVKAYFGIGNGNSLAASAAAGDTVLRAEQKLILRAGGDAGGAAIDASGNLGLGVTPAVYAANSRVFHIDGGANAAEIRLTTTTSGSSATNGGLLSFGGNDFYIWNVENSFLSFGTNNTERLRITSGGLLTFAGTTSSFPALKRSSTTLQVRLADDSGDAPLSAGVINANSGSLTTAAFTATNTTNAAFTPGIDVLAPNLTATNATGLTLGRNAATNNWASMYFYYAGNGSASNRLDYYFYGSGKILSLLASGSVVVNSAAIATSATDGFLYVPTCAGTPTGTPTTQTGTAPIVIDTTNNKLYFYSGGQWRDAGP